MTSFLSHKAGNPTHSPEGSFDSTPPGARLRYFQRRQAQIHRQAVGALAVALVSSIAVLAVFTLTAWPL